MSWMTSIRDGVKGLRHSNTMMPCSPISPIGGAGQLIRVTESTLKEKPQVATDISETLKQRGSQYGSFIEQGRIEQNIKAAFQDSPNWPSLAPDAKSALEMMATKISRILKGNPEFHDSWHDIVGYAKLVADRIERGEHPS